MVTAINPGNWRNYKLSEANKIFSIDQIVMYDHGFTRFNEKLGKVTKITPAGIVYAVKVNLKMVKRNKLDHPADCQLAGWEDYDPKKIVSVEKEEMRFLLWLNNKSNWNEIKKEREYFYFINWHGAKHSGLYDLRPIKLKKDGLVRVSHDSIL